MANITTQTIRVDLSTGKVIPTAYTHQNDTARTLVFDMYNGGLPYSMTGHTVKFAYKSPIVNGRYTVIAGSSMASGTVSGNTVSVTLPADYTAISGVGLLTMIITPTSGTIRPVNIKFIVQKSADGDDTIAGASDFPAALDEIAENWLDENISIQIDDTLSVSGKAADAKVTGDEISELDGQIGDLKSELNLKVDISGINQVTPMNMQIIDGYENLVNPSDFTDEKFLNANGTLGDNSNYQVSGFIPVISGQTYIFVARLNEITDAPTRSTQGIRSHVFYDVNKEVISGIATMTETPITIPDGACYLRFCVSNIYPYMLLTDGSERKPYIPYGTDTYQVKDEYLPEYHDFVTLDDIKSQTGLVSPSMTTFMYYSENMVDPSKYSNGYINQINGVFSANDSYRATDYLPVESGETYGFAFSSYSTPITRYAWYDANKVFISGAMERPSDFDYVLTAPENAAYFRYSVNYDPLYVPSYFGKASSAPEYEPFGAAHVMNRYIPEEDLNSVIFNLPSKIYAYVGYELNIYFENLVEDWTKYHWDVSCTKGRQTERGFNITPVSGDVGTYDLSITIWLSDFVKKTVSTSLIIPATSAGSGTTKKVIVLGDSTTNNGIAVTKLNENFSSDSMNIQTLGTRGTAPNNHEGRSGWRFSSYFQPSADSDVQNPWYNPSSQTFDANYYFANSGIAKPDWLFINLGINDTFGFTTDDGCESGMATIMNQCGTMIDSIKSASPSTKIGLCLTIPPNHSQDAFGKAYQCGQTRDRYKRNNTIWVNKLIEEYDGKESEGIYLIPIYTNLDTVYNMGMETLPVNARNTTTTYQSPIGNGGVHPVESGYWQIADVYTAFLKAQT